MAASDIKKLVESLPEDKKRLLLNQLEKSAGVSESDISAAVKNPETQAKLTRLAAKIDPKVLNELTGDPVKLAALINSPQVKSAISKLRDKG